MDADFALTGFAELEQQLKQMGLAASRRVLRAASKAAAVPVEQSARAGAITAGHVDSGTLVQEISAKVRVNRKKKTPETPDVEARVGIFKPRVTKIRFTRKYGAIPAVQPQVYGYWLEHGVEPHYKIPEDKRDLQARDRPKMHPGFPAKPFLRPALESNQGQIIDIYAEQLLTSIQAEVRRAQRIEARRRQAR